MDSLELKVLNKEQKTIELKVSFSDSIAINKILSYYELKNLEVLVREAVKEIEG